MEILELCNNALDLVGQGTHIEDMQENSKEADLCRRNLDSVIKRALDKFNFSFVRKDEAITEDNEIDVVCIPYEHAYSLPTDLQRVLFLSDINDDSSSESIHTEKIKYNFRLINGEKVLVTDYQAPFVIHYQSKDYELNLLPDTFVEAVEYLLASKLAIALIHGTTGLQISQQLLQTGNMYLQMSAGQDAQQGSNGIDIDKEKPSFIQARE